MGVEHVTWGGGGVAVYNACIIVTVIECILSFNTACYGRKHETLLENFALLHNIMGL